RPGSHDTCRRPRLFVTLQSVFEDHYRVIISSRSSCSQERKGAKRVLVPPEKLCRSIADYGRRTIPIGLFQESSLPERDTHGLEVIRRHEAEVGDRIVLSGTLDIVRI